MMRFEGGRRELAVSTNPRNGLAPRKRRQAMRIRRFLPRIDFRAFMGVRR